jgi:hypothetical protein
MTEKRKRGRPAKVVSSIFDLAADKAAGASDSTALESLVEKDYYQLELEEKFPDLPTWIRMEYTAKEFVRLPGSIKMALLSEGDESLINNDSLMIPRD